MRRARVIGTGHYVPERVVTNDDLSKLFATSDEWIQERSGIRERRYIDVGKETGASDLAHQAALPALEMAGLEPSDIDCIIFATLSPDYTFPGSGVLLQRLLGIDGIPSYDVRNQCSGYLYALEMADVFIRSGKYERVLVAGSEVHSTGIEFADRGRNVTVLFGDGAGVTILGPTDAPDRGILSTHLHSDGRFAEKLMIRCPSSRVTPCRVNPGMIEDGSVFPAMDGKFVFKYAVQYMPEVVQEALRANDLSMDDIDHFLPHQANLRINQTVAKRLGLRDEICYNNIDRYGNLSAGSIPTLLDEVVRDGRIGDGDIVVMAGFGSGFTWGSVLMRWQAI